MTYRSVLGPYSNIRVLVSAVAPRTTGFYHTVSGTGTVLDYSGSPTNDYNGPTQIINVSNDPASYVGASTFAVNISYNTSTLDQTLAGVGVRIHYDSSKIELLSVTNLFSTDIVSTSVGPFQDTSDFDNNTSTDKYIQITWADSNGAWPNVSLPLNLATLNFSVSDDAAAAGTTPLNLTPVNTAAGYVFRTDNFPLEISFISWDIDGNGYVDALSDGLLFIRYLFDLRGFDLWAGLINHDVVLTPDEVEANAKTVVESLGDVDGDGNTDALTDGILLMRYLFDMRGDDLIAGAVSPNATRTTAAQIEAYIGNFFPLEGGEEGEDEEEIIIEQRSAPRVVTSYTQPESAASFPKLKSLTALTRVRGTAKEKVVQVLETHTAVSTLVNYLRPNSILNYRQIAASDIGWHLGEDFARTITSSQGVDDTFAFAFTRLVTSGFSVSDSAALLSANQALDGLDFGDEAILSIGLNRTYEEGFGFTDSIVLSPHKVFSGSASLHEEVGKTLNKRASESMSLFDTLDAVTISAVAKKSDTFGFGEIHQFSLSKSESENQSVYEKIAKSIAYSRNEHDFFTVEEFADVGSSKDKINYFGFTDDFSRVATFKRSPQENINAVESFSLGFSKSESETQAVDELVAKTISYTRTETDSYELLEALEKTLAKTKAESFVVSDAHQFSLSKSESENQSVYEKIAKSIAYSRNEHDFFTIEEFTDVGSSKDKINYFGFTDDFSKVVAFVRGPETPATIVDTFGFRLEKPVEDPQNIMERIQKGIGYTRPQSDHYELSETVGKTLAKAKADPAELADNKSFSLSKIKNDAPHVTEIISKDISYNRSPHDFVYMVDDPGLSNLTSERHEFGFTDDLSKVVTFKRAAEEALYTGDEYSFTLAKLEGETQYILEFTNKLIAYSRTAQESVDFSDSLKAILGKLYSDSVAVTEAYRSSLTKKQSENQSVYEKIAKSIAYSRNEHDFFTIEEFADVGSSKDKINRFMFTDAVALRMVTKRYPEESINFTDLCGLSFTKPINDIQNTLETISKEILYNRTESNVCGVSDSVVVQPKLGKSESLGLDELYKVSLSKPEYELGVLGEAVTKTVAYVRSEHDYFSVEEDIDIDDAKAKINYFGFSDSITLQTQTKRNALDPVGVTEQAQLALEKPFGDNSSVSEVVTKAINYSRDVTSTLALTASVFEVVKNSAVADHFGASDGSTLTFNKAFNEEPVVSEAVTKSVAYSRGEHDYFNLEEFADISSVKDKINQFYFVDTVTLRLVTLRRPEDPLSFTDQLSYTANKGLNEAQNTSENISKLIYYSRAVPTESIGFSETVTTTLNAGSVLASRTVNSGAINSTVIN